MAKIHPTAIVDGSAEIDASVEVRAYAVIGPQVVIGADSIIHSHAVLDGPMTLGARNEVFSFASIGALSQDVSAKRSDPTSTVIGDDNVIREYVSIQRGTMKEWDTKQGQTRIGSRNLIMNYCHVAHDCVLGNDIIMANNASLAGHVEIGDFVGLGVHLGLSILSHRCVCLHRVFGRGGWRYPAVHARARQPGEGAHR